MVRKMKATTHHIRNRGSRYFIHFLKDTLPHMTGRDWCIMLILGVVQVGGGYTFYNLGLQKVSAQKASIIALWEMILGPVWVAVFLQEYSGIPVLVGFVIILTGIFLDAKLSKPLEETAECHPATVVK